MSNKKKIVRIEFIGSIILVTILLGLVLSWGVMIETGWLTGEISIIEHAIRVQFCFAAFVGGLSFLGISITWWIDHEITLNKNIPRISIRVQESAQGDAIQPKEMLVIMTG